MSTPKFKIGDSVICIDDRVGPVGGPSVVYKKQYKILDFQICSCGKVAYDIGLKNDELSGTRCSSCNSIFAGKQIQWCGEFRFEKPIEDKNSAKEENIKKMEFTQKELLVGISQN